MSNQRLRQSQLIQYLDMSQSQKISEGVYRQGDEVIVVLPSDRVVIIQEMRQDTQNKQHVVHQSPLQTIQNKIHDIFHIKPPQQPVVVVERTVVQTPVASDMELQLRRYLSEARDFWRNFDSNAACCLTSFKRLYILPIGDIPVRSVCMAVSTGLIYSILGRRNPNILIRGRNLAMSFVLNGLVWLPEMFNPFLFRQQRI